MKVEFKDLADGVEVLDAGNLTLQEQQEHDYLDWAALERGEDSRSFVRYQGRTYLTSDFSADWGLSRGGGLPPEFAGWHGFLADTFYSGVVIRYHDDPDVVTLATFYAS